jgi:hypothetical protein
MPGAAKCLVRLKNNKRLIGGLILQVVRRANAGDACTNDENVEMLNALLALC